MTQTFKKYIGITDMEWRNSILFCCKTYEVTEMRAGSGSVSPNIVNKQFQEHTWERVSHAVTFNETTDIPKTN